MTIFSKIEKKYNSQREVFHGKYLKGREFCRLLISQVESILIRCSGSYNFKVGLSPSKNISFIWFNDSPSKIMKYTFYFILKALFALKVFRIFGHVVKTV